ncbi:MAG: hypothetical protein DCC71_17895 [Proteobacteria bacterium]|nr:MAG: hypothetical protein DCC71_17895 [Pseudomonadota bacterium]
MPTPPPSAVHPVVAGSSAPSCSNTMPPGTSLQVPSGNDTRTLSMCAESLSVSVRSQTTKSCVTSLKPGTFSVWNAPSVSTGKAVSCAGAGSAGS